LLVEEISHYEALLRVQRRNLRVLELQAARHGPFDVPLPIQGALSELRMEVVRIERMLLALRAQLDMERGILVADHPAVEGQITFFAAADLLATARFYGDTMGLTLVLEQAGCRVYEVVRGAYLGFCQVVNDVVVPDWPIITLVTVDVSGWYEHLTGRGVSIDEVFGADAQRGMLHFVARDPNGYRIEVRSKEELRIVGTDRSVSHS
jgi:catechol 2,3-dioxygenase-like lactoylglutathione lyase family enzyme